MTSKDQCKRFDSCGAPLCPLDEDSLQNGLWYPDEESCESVEFRMMPWIKRERKISKRARESDHYFLFKMLQRDIIIKKGIAGIDPDRDEPGQLISWFGAHPEKKPLTDLQKQNLEKLTKHFGFKKKC